MLLGDMLLDSVSKSTRNLYPVVNEANILVGIVLLDDIREFMFDTALYNSTTVATFMNQPPDVILYGMDSMEKVMEKFQKSGHEVFNYTLGVTIFWINDLWFLFRW